MLPCIHYYPFNGKWTFLNLLLVFVIQASKENASLINEGDPLDFMGHDSAFWLSSVHTAESCHLTALCSDQANKPCLAARK